MRAALAFLMGASVSSSALAQPAPNAPTSQEEIKLERFEVTGSRVKRVDFETPSPTVAYSTVDIETKGYTNIGDFIQSLPFNTGSANSIYQTASFTRGAATANIRGLGSQRFLVLVNGRRAVSYALTNAGNRSVFDFNSLPLAAIEGIEFLKDGASAIYGADAVTGVLNVKLKRNYQGLSLSGYYGNTLGHDSGLVEFSGVVGAGSGRTNVMVAVNAKTQNSNFLRDYDIKTTDYSPRGGANLNSSLNYPANLTLTRAQATAAGIAFPTTTAGSWTYHPVNGQPMVAPTLAQFRAAPANSANTAGVLPNEARYNFAQTYQLYPAYDYISAYAQIEHEFSDTIQAFGSVTFTDNFTYYAFTPGVIQYGPEGLTLPANNPYNPFGIPLTSLLARTSFYDVRKFDTDSMGATFLGGLRGTVFDRWDWETAASYGFNRVTTVARNAVRATSYQSALNGTLSGHVGKFLNPFGPSDPELIKAIFTSSTGSNRSAMRMFDANVSGSLFELPGGEVGLAVGAEFRNENLTTNPDTAAYLGSGGGRPLSGDRDVTSAYVEVTIPVIRQLELQAAARYEDYSDFGDITKPKIAAKVRPLPENRFANVILRGSYSESFQAPALGLLYASQTIGFTPGVQTDPLRPQDPATQLRIITGGNPALLPEEAESYYGGLILEDIAGVRDLSVSFDYFKIKIDQVIVTPSATYLLSERGRQQFPGGIVRDNTAGTPGPIQFLQSVPSNNPDAYQIYRGYDLGVNYRIRNTRFGDFALQAEATRVLEIGSDSGLGGGYFDNVGLWNNPKWRGQASVSWTRGDYAASIASDYIGNYFNDAYTAAGWPQGSYTLFHTQVSYNEPFFGTRITLGVNNAFDKRPPFNGYDTSGIDPNTYGAGALGRFVYVRVRKDF
jgi:iron complex outermembrane recepter protein